MLTDKKQLIKFINIRNTQEIKNKYEYDASQCNFSFNEFGQPEKIKLLSITIGYKWSTEFGTLREKYGKMELINK